MKSTLSCSSCSRPLRVARLECDGCSLSVEGALELGPLAHLSHADQAFVIAFVRHHGSIRKMERLFEISYPTVKKRLNAITERLDCSLEAPGVHADILDQLDRGQIDFDEAMNRLGRSDP